MDESVDRQVPVVLFTSTGDALGEAWSHAIEPSIALDRLAAEDISIVFCSGKTRAEIERVQQYLGVTHPFVCEHGGAVFIPQGYFGFAVPNARSVAGYEAVEFGRPYAEVVDTLRRAAERLRIEVVGFSDMSIADVAADCGLSLMDARLAKLREYGEPFRIVSANATEARSRLFKALRASKLGCGSGIRYDHAGAPRGKDAGLDLLRSLYQQAYGAVMTIAVPGRLGSFPGPRRSEASAAGWAEAIVELVRQHRRSACPQ